MSTIMKWSDFRFIMMAMGVKRVLGVTGDDVIYTSLPLYHTAGGLLGCGQVILGGSTQVIKSKFSASNFFKDCIKYECTVCVPSIILLNLKLPTKTVINNTVTGRVEDTLSVREN